MNKAKIWSGLFLLAVVPLCVLSGCKKYGYSFEDGFNNNYPDSATITVDTSLSQPDFSMYAQAMIYPGVVGDLEPRLKDVKVQVDLDYLRQLPQLRISVTPGTIMSTGLYAPTGEPVIVDVPAGVNSLTAQIGAWSDNLSSIQASKPDKMKREPVIFTKKQLFPGRNYIRSPFGGPIYIIANVPSGQKVTLNFSGACKMADFVLGQTDPVEWQKEMKSTTVPWLELRAPHVIFTVPTAKAQTYGISDPEKLLQTWEDIFNKDFTQWEGLSDHPADPIDQAPGLPWRCVADIQPSVGAMHSGYPVVFTDGVHYFDVITNVSSILKRASWGIEHEVGHNNQQGNWMMSNMTETTNNLFVLKTAHRLGVNLFDGNSGWESNIGNALDFASDPDPDKKWLTDNRIENCFTPFLQLFEKMDWGIMTALYQQTRRAQRLSVNDQDRIDFMYQVMSDQTKTNLIPFFEAWGWKVSTQGKKAVYAKNYPILKRKIWTYDPRTQKGGDEPFTYIPKLPDPLDRSLWEVIDKDSEHPGRGVELLFDGDPSTIWSTPFNTGNDPGYPHYFTVDMHGEQEINAFALLGRAGDAYNQNPAKVDIYVGDDPGSLEKVVAGAALDLTEKTVVYLPEARIFRYFKMVFTVGGDPAMPKMNEAEVEAYPQF